MNQDAAAASEDLHWDAIERIRDMESDELGKVFSHSEKVLVGVF